MYYHILFCVWNYAEENSNVFRMLIITAFVLKITLLIKCFVNSIIRKPRYTVILILLSVTNLKHSSNGIYNTVVSMPCV